MSTPAAQGSTASSRSLFSKVLVWLLLLGLAVGLVVLADALGKRLKSPSFAILRVQNGWVYAIIGLLVAVALICVTAWIGKVWGERSRRGRKVSYWAVLSDQLTHLFIWIVILAALYPLLFVIGASLDPLNRLTQSVLGGPSEPLLVRARVLPSFQGYDLSNYAALFDGVNIYAWQWVLVGIGIVSAISLGLISLFARFEGGRPSLGLIRARRFTTWALIGAVVLFFAFLLPGQFTGSRNASKFLLWIRNTLLISGLTGLMAILLTTTAGYAMARLRFPGRFQSLLFFIFVQMFPGFLGLVAIYTLIRALDLTNTFTGVILAYSGGAIAFGTWIYKGYVESLPASLEEAALVDGCTRWTAFTRIVLPLSGPMLVFIFLLQFNGTYAEFILASILLNGVENWNVGVGLRSFNQGAFSTQYGTFAAAAVLGSLPIIALFYSFQQVFVSGTVAGGVKE